MKKVNTYGRKRTQIIAVHTDLTPAKPSTFTAPPLLTPNANRPPLFSKPSSDNHATPIVFSSQQDDPPKRSKGLAAHGKEGLRSETSTPEPLKPRKARKPDTKPAVAPSVEAIRQTSGGYRAGKPKRRVVEVVIGSGKPKAAPITDMRTLDRLSSLNISEPSASPPRTATESMRAIADLLRACSSPRVHPFSGFLSSSTFLNQAFDALAIPTIRKVGEASYSEVFGVKIAGRSEVVVKIVPLLSAETEGMEGLPDCSDTADVAREIEITRSMGDMPGAGFVKLLGAFVVKGKYPEVLLQEWDRYKSTEGSSSARPDTFTAEQHFAVMVLPNGGTDLEAFGFSSVGAWTEVMALFRQTAQALAKAEQVAQFEHRDLHEGQILVNRLPVDLTSSISDVPGAELQVTIIDLGLSRLTTKDGRVRYSEPPAEVFEGKGDQWDVYRALQRVSGGDWKGFHPESNALWLCYLLRYMIHNKGIRKPRLSASTAPRQSSPIKLELARRFNAKPQRSSVEASNRAAYEEAIVLEKMLVAGGLCPSAPGTTKGKKLKQADLPVRNCRSAADVLTLLEALSGDM